MKISRTIVRVTLVLCIGGTSAIAQSEDLQSVLRRLCGLEETMRSVERELESLIAVSRNSRDARLSSPVEDVPPFVVNVTGAAAIGSPDAKTAVIEYSDFQCPFCGAYAKQAYRELQRQFVSTGKVIYFFRNFPLEDIHPQALKAAEAAECVRESGRFWDMHDRLFTNQGALALSDLTAHARALGVEMSPFQACLTEGQTTAKVRAEQAEARRLGIAGTPTFLLGRIESGGRVRVTRKIVGSQPIEIFGAALQTMLPTNGPK